MMEEIDTVTSTYEDVQCKNDELRQTIALKEETMVLARPGPSSGPTANRSTLSAGTRQVW